MTTIITGASGAFGKMVTELLLARVAPEELVLVSRKPDSLARLAERGVKVRYGDFDEQDSLEAASRAATKCFSSARWTSVNAGDANTRPR
jgi:NAD(P)H dehydrogenase (quinone)